MSKPNNFTTITVRKEFKEVLELHGKRGETQEGILLRLLPKDFSERFTGDRPTKTYSEKDVDSKKYKRSQKTGRKE